MKTRSVFTHLQGFTGYDTCYDENRIIIQALNYFTKKNFGKHGNITHEILFSPQFLTLC